MSSTYHIDGVEYPRVTSVLGVIDKGIGLIKWAATVGWDASQKIFRDAASKGSRNHAEIASVLKLPPESFASFLANPERAESVLQVLLAEFLTRFKARPLHIELTLASKHGFAGTLDALLWVKYHGKDELWLVDWKFTKKFRQEAALQTAAYEQLVFENLGLRVDRRVCIRFTDKKWYKKFHNNPEDFKGFLGALEVYKWLHRKGSK